MFLLSCRNPDALNSVKPVLVGYDSSLPSLQEIYLPGLVRTAEDETLATANSSNGSSNSNE